MQSLENFKKRKQISLEDKDNVAELVTDKNK